MRDKNPSGRRLTPPPSPLEQPLPDRAPRTVTTLFAGRLLHGDGGETLCRVRNISTSGMMVEAEVAIAPGEQVAVELRNGERLDGTVSWSGEGRIGIQFVCSREIEALLLISAEGRPRRGAPRPRAPRFDVGCRARVDASGQSWVVAVANVSQSGARLRLADDVHLPGELMLVLPGIASRRCALRWRLGEEAGLAFIDMIPFAELSTWLAASRTA